MTRNIGDAERIIRAIVGLALLSLVFVGPKSLWGLIGIIPLATAAIGWLPAIAMPGVTLYLVLAAVAAASFLALATALGHDAFYRVRDVTAMTSRRLAVTRVSLVASVTLAGLLLITLLAILFF